MAWQLDVLPTAGVGSAWAEHMPDQARQGGRMVTAAARWWSLLLHCKSCSSPAPHVVSADLGCAHTWRHVAPSGRARAGRGCWEAAMRQRPVAAATRAARPGGAGRRGLGFGGGEGAGMGCVGGRHGTGRADLWAGSAATGRAHCVPQVLSTSPGAPSPGCAVPALLVARALPRAHPCPRSRCAGQNGAPSPTCHRPLRANANIGSVRE